MTREEYIKANRKKCFTIWQYSEPKYECPRCQHGKMRKNLSMVLCSSPPMYQYECDSCGYVDFLDF